MLTADAEGRMKFEGYAEVCLMGHTTLWGYVKTLYFGNETLLHVESERIPEREVTLTTWACFESDWLAAGSKVKKAEIPAKGFLFSPKSIYLITPCTQVEVEMALTENSPILSVIEKADSGSEVPF